MLGLAFRFLWVQLGGGKALFDFVPVLSRLLTDLIAKQLSSVLVLILNALIFNLYPSMGSLAGMAIVVAGVAGISLLEGEGEACFCVQARMIAPNSVNRIQSC